MVDGAEAAAAKVYDALSAEGGDLSQHPQVGWGEKIGRLSKQACPGRPPIIAAAAPFEAAAIGGHRKAHAACDRLDAKAGEHPGQVRIVELVVDDEADIGG